MTVGELIAALQKHDRGMTVFYAAEDNGSYWVEVSTVSRDSVVRDKDCPATADSSRLAHAVACVTLG